MNLVRLGHLHTPTGVNDEGYCNTALVIKVIEEDDGGPSGTYVNLAAWSYEGSQEIRRGVLVDDVSSDHSTFHLSSDCPWKR